MEKDANRRSLILDHISKHHLHAYAVYWETKTKVRLLTIEDGMIDVHFKV